MPAQWAAGGGRRTGRRRRAHTMRALAGGLYLTVAVQLVGGFLLGPDGGISGVVPLAGMASGVCALTLVAFVRPWASRPDQDLEPDVLEARRTAQVRAFALVTIAAIAVLGSATLVAGYGDFTAGLDTFAAWLLGLIMLSLGGPSAALAWSTDQE
jgi:nitrate reductase NapE component